MKLSVSKGKSSSVNHSSEIQKKSEFQSLAPLQIIRTETVISRLPIHNLVKGGSVNIQITQRNENGKVSLHWEVSPSNKFGHPGQLAYKLDTIVINRIIDEIGRPVPRMIKIGTLNQLCNELGSQKNELKRSLQQNAATTISAKLQYKGKDGGEKKLEAIFARYSVVFTGETLPTGEKADEIYIIFNEPYLEVLNSAPVRPLSYDYLRLLSPTAQRFYEIVSYRIYAALKYDHPKAKLQYSEYCTYSAQQRHENFERVRVQMYRVHKPHLESTYLSKVEYEPTKDSEGKPDWIIFYTPGPKSRAEFDTFNTRNKARNEVGLLPDGSVENTPQPYFDVDDCDDEGDFTPLRLVQQFHLLARHVKSYKPLARELAQATQLLKTYGASQAQFLIEYAVAEAVRTNFKMRQFGAVLQYVEEGIRIFEKRSNTPQIITITEDKQLNFWDENQSASVNSELMIETALSFLSDATVDERREEIKKGIIAKLPSAKDWSDDVMEQTIRATLVKELAL